MTKLLIAIFAVTLVFSASARADADATSEHGPLSKGGFSHQFSRRAHLPETPQLSFHYGLVQPILLRGFNAAIDVRYKRFVATYSHGQGLEFSDLGSRAERDAGVSIRAPWSTGFGVGVVLVDELYLLADFKLHALKASLAGESLDYRTMTVGLELGYRLFLYKGLHIAPVLRYWPTVASSIPRGGSEIGGSGLTHKPLPMGTHGFFANVLVGWTFQL